MRFLRTGIVAIGMSLPMLAAFAQGGATPPDADRPFTPVAGSAPRTLPATSAPIVRSTLPEPIPVPTARLEPPPLPASPPAFRSTLAEPVPVPVPTARLEPPAPPTSYGARTMSFADGVGASFDLVYASLPGFRPLTLDLYQPRAQDAPMPLVVFIHGGGWNNGDARHAGTFADFPSQLAALAARGYVVASVNYRLSQEARFPAALQDVKSAIRWLRGHATQYNIDTTRVAAWGTAAGGQLAALAGVTCGVDRFEPDGDANAKDLPSNCVQAVIDWYGVTDLQTLAADNGQPANQRDTFTSGSSSAAGSYLGCEPAQCAPGIARLTSPLGFINAMSPPFLIQHGALDTEVSPSQSRKLQDTLRKAGVPSELVIYPDLGHDFARNGKADPASNAQAMEKLESFLAATFPSRRIAGKIAPTIRRGLN